MADDFMYIFIRFLEYFAHHLPDLVRFTDLARRRGQTGLLTFLASFFKSPYGVEEHCFDRQFQMLEDWARGSAPDSRSG